MNSSFAALKLSTVMIESKPSKDADADVFSMEGKLVPSSTTSSFFSSFFSMIYLISFYFKS